MTDTKIKVKSIEHAKEILSSYAGWNENEPIMQIIKPGCGHNTVTLIWNAGNQLFRMYTTYGNTYDQTETILPLKEMARWIYSKRKYLNGGQ